MAKKLLVDVWSDIACPWCYVGKRRFEAALSLFAHKDDVVVTWRAFELDPSAPRVRDPKVSYAGRLAAKYGVPVAQGEQMLQRMTATAAEEGLDFHFERAQGGNTFDAHRLLHLAQVKGVQDAVKERLLRAYFTEGVSMSDHESLVALAAEAGLDADEARAVLASDRYVAEVRKDEGTAREFGISGVPFFVVGGRYSISGAQPAKAILEVLEKAWTEARDDSPMAEGAACGPDGCA
jgi:predicted DsbA family dithiol-disulfide isomerase